MNTLYFLDAHTPVLTSSQINNTFEGDQNGTRMNGSFVVAVPNDVTLSGDPGSLNELISKKYTGILANFPGYQQILYDDLLDSTGINVANSSKVTLGSRGTISAQNGGIIETNPAATVGTPSEVIVTWDAFEVKLESPYDNIATLAYAERDLNNFTVDVSLNGGTSFNTVYEGTPFTVPPADQGSSLVLRFTNVGGSRRWLGSWAVIY